MNVLRPCLSCGRDAPASADACPACAAPLVAHAAVASSLTQVAVAAPRRGLGTVLVVILVAAGVGAVAWWGLGRLRSREVEAALRWSEPESVAAWARGYLAREGVAADDVRAAVIGGEVEARRVIVTSHAESERLPRIVRALARMLVAARDAGTDSAAHLAVIRHGDTAWLVPVGEAAELATSAAALARGLRLNEAELDLEDEGPPPADVAPLASEGPGSTSEAAGAPDATAPDASRAVGGDAPPAGSAPVAGAAGATTEPPAPGGTPAPAGSATQPAGGSTTSIAASGASGPAEPSRSSASSAAPGPRSDTDAPPARLARAQGPIPRKAEPGAQATLLRFQVAAGARRDLTLRAVTVRAKGSLSDFEDIEWVDLWRDPDLSGRATGRPAMEKLGDRQSFTDDDGAVTFDGLSLAFGKDGLPVSLVVTADVAPEVGGGTIELGIRETTAIVLEDETGEVVLVRGAPLRGPIVRVDGNIPEDLEQQRLDELAAQGPDAVDPNLERLAEEARRAAEAARPGGASGPTGASGPSDAGTGATGPGRPRPFGSRP